MFNKERKNKELMKNIISQYLLLNIGKINKRVGKICFVENKYAVKFNTYDTYLQPIITNFKSDAEEDFHITICLNTLYLAYLESLECIEEFTLNFSIKLIQELESDNFDPVNLYYSYNYTNDLLIKGGV